MTGTPPQVQEINWQEAVARLARERTLAETFAAMLKKYGDMAAVDRGSLAYGEAKAEYDGVVGGLVVALARKGRPESLADLEGRLKRGFDKREAFCRNVLPLVPQTAGEKGPITEVVTGIAKPVIDAVVAIWSRVREIALR
jgi:hypothetical protein